MQTHATINVLQVLPTTSLVYIVYPYSGPGTCIIIYLMGYKAVVLVTRWFLHGKLYKVEFGMEWIMK